MSSSGRRRNENNNVWAVLTALGTIALVVIGIITIAIMRSSTGEAGKNSDTPTPLTSPSHATVQSSSSPSPTHSTLRPAFSYKDVPLTVLCYSDGATENFYSGCGSGLASAEYGSRVYTFVADAPTIDSNQTQLSFPKTTCRSLRLTFGIQPQDGAPAGLKVTVSVVQSDAPPTYSSVTRNHIGRLITKLRGGPWDIDTVANMPVTGAWDLLMNGSASCSTTSGE
jgi:hypothetical protein